MAPEDGFACVDVFGKRPYTGDLLKAPDLARGRLSVG